MPIDYQIIAQENIEKYGTAIEVYGPVLLADLYSDQTHFVYELLQNAEDAQATRVEFRLYEEYLEVEHNGRLFNEADIRGICGLVEGTKNADLTQIGKFGIGFKSVYAHTRSPNVHSGEDHFAIQHYVRPYPIEPVPLPEDRTLFVFPFNHLQKSPEESYSEIARRLTSLGIRTLLFLKNVEDISYWIENGAEGIYLRETQTEPDAPFMRHITLVGEKDQQSTEEHWLVFERGVHASASNDTPVESTLKVEIAFLHDEFSPDTGPVVRRLPRSNLVVFFPTEKDTRLGFLIQGHYRTTPARDNVPQRNEFNRFLTEQTAELVVDVLRYLRARSWLNVSVLHAMPLNSEDFDDTLFEPIYACVLEAIRDEDLLPTHEGGYVSGQNARLASSANLRELLNEEQLGDLLELSGEVYWLSGQITRDRTPELWRYLLNEVNVQEIDSEAFVRRLTHEFLIKQTDAWITQLYEFGAEQPSLKNSFKRRPIIRLISGEHTHPFGGHKNDYYYVFSHDDDPPQAFLPTELDSSFPTVKKSLCTEKALQFLTNLGLTVPEAADEVIQQILPQYPLDNTDWLTHQNHMRVIFEALKTSPHEKRTRLIKELKSTEILLAQNSEGKFTFKKPGSIYFGTEDLKAYFYGNPEAWLLAEESIEIYQSDHDILDELGVAEQVRIKHRSPESHWSVNITSSRGSHVRGLQGFDPDCSIEGLEYAVARPTLVRAQYIWHNLLLPHKNWIYGVVQRSTRQDYSWSSREEQPSRMGSVVRNNAWLPDRNGYWCRPNELTLDDLPDGFEHDEELAEQLGMRALPPVSDPEVVDEFDALLSQRGVQEDFKQVLSEALARNDPDELKEFASMWENFRRERHEQQITENQAPQQDELIDYALSADDAFNRPGKTSIDDYESSNHFVRDADQRRERKKQQVKAAKDQEPSKETRFTLVKSRRWEGKDEYTRTFLHEEYGGKCQICGHTFARRRDGSPYFEAVYIVPYTKGRWLDDPANTLCLCANHVAQFLHGAVESDFVEQVMSFQNGLDHRVDIRLCGRNETIRFTARHIIDLQAIIEEASASRKE